MLTLIKKLISFDTTQNETAAMQFIQQYVTEKYGEKVVCEQQPIGKDDRYNLIIKNTNQPDIILAGHVDTVPELSKEQFIPKIEGNRLYGRWAVDMKAWVAINIELIEFMLKKNIKFRVLCYADEEYTFTGMKAFVKEYAGNIFPKLTIVTEPTNAKIYTGFRGVAAINLEIKGKSVHSSRKHLGINAIEEYVAFIAELENYVQSKDLSDYQSLTNLAGISGGIMKDGEIIWQDNIVPNIAKGQFSLRLGNDFSYEEFERFMQQHFGKKGVEIVDVSLKIRCKPMIQNNLEEKYGVYGEVVEWYTFGYSDVQLIKEQLGGDCLLIGPWPWELAHQAEEYVDIESIDKAKTVIEKILKNIAVL